MKSTDSIVSANDQYWKITEHNDDDPKGSKKIFWQPIQQ